MQLCLEAVDDYKKDWRRLKKISECSSETTGLNGLSVCLSKQPSRLSPTSKCTCEDIKDILMTFFFFLRKLQDSRLISLEHHMFKNCSIKCTHCI